MIQRKRDVILSNREYKVREKQLLYNTSLLKLIQVRDIQDNKTRDLIQPNITKVCDTMEQNNNTRDLKQRNNNTRDTLTCTLLLFPSLSLSHETQYNNNNKY